MTDVNDNAPVFEKDSYECVLSEVASRGHFVASVGVYDPDVEDQNKHTFSIVHGNELEAFSLEPSTGENTI